MKKTKNKILSGILALTMAVGMLPMASTTAYAATEYEMAMGTSGVKAREITPNGINNATVAVEGDKIVMGEYKGNPVTWVRLNDTDNLMLSEYVLGTTAFESDGSGYYSDGENELQVAMQAFYGSDNTADTGSLGLSDEEKAIVSETNLTAESMGDGSDYITEGAIPALESQHFFPLSGDLEVDGEFWTNVGQGSDLAKQKEIGSEASVPFWWLRSSNHDGSAFAVWGDDGGHSLLVLDDIGGVRPAFNANLSSVLFTSAAEGGKSSYVGEADPILGEISGTAPTTWKMTLKDDTRKFAVTEDTLILDDTNVVSFSYTGAETGLNEYISVMIVDNSDNITHYAKIEDLSSAADGTASFTIPTGLTGDVTLKIFNEQDNGDNETDYSSAFVEKIVTVEKQTNNLQSVTQSDVAYGTALSPQVAYSGGATSSNGGAVVFEYKEQGSADSTYTSTAPQYVGDYTVRATSAATATTLEATPQTGNFSITTADQTPTITANTSVQVDKSIDLSTLVENAQGDVSFIKVSGDGALKGTTYTAPNTTGTAVFTVDITAKDLGGGSENEYNSYIGASAIKVTITPAPTSPNPTPSNPEVTVPSNVSSPQTGDNNHVLWHLFVALISLGGIGVVVYRRKVQNG